MLKNSRRKAIPGGNGSSRDHRLQRQDHWAPLLFPFSPNTQKEIGNVGPLASLGRILANVKLRNRSGASVGYMETVATIRKPSRGERRSFSPFGTRQPSSAAPRHHPAPPLYSLPFSLGSTPACRPPHRPARTHCSAAAGDACALLPYRGGSGTCVRTGRRHETRRRQKGREGARGRAEGQEGRRGKIKKKNNRGEEEIELGGNSLESRETHTHRVPLKMIKMSGCLSGSVSWVS